MNRVKSTVYSDNAWSYNNEAWPDDEDDHACTIDDESRLSPIGCEELDEGDHDSSCEADAAMVSLASSSDEEESFLLTYDATSGRPKSVV